METNKVIEEVKLLRFQDGDTLIVKVPNLPIEIKQQIQEQLKESIPKNLRISIIISPKEFEYEVLRKEKECQD